MRHSIEIEIKCKWWVNYYIQSLHAFSVIFGVMPDADKVSQFIAKHGVRFNVKTPH